MAGFSEDGLTRAVLASFDGSADPRTREVLRALVRHVHAFVREVGLTQDEWLAGIRFLTEAGHVTDERRQEFVLLSDVLGVSMLVDAVAHRDGPGATTESTVMGPFHTGDAPQVSHGATIATGPEADRGQPCVVRGRVLSTGGAPLVGAEVDVWQADDVGFYDVQPESDMPDVNLRGVLRTDADGAFWFRTVRPRWYPIPADGPVGRLLRSTGRHPNRPAHIHFWLRAEGHRDVVTHLFDQTDPWLDRDAVFGVKDELVVPFVEHDDPVRAAELGVASPFVEVTHDFVLAPG